METANDAGVSEAKGMTSKFRWYYHRNACRDPDKVVQPGGKTGSKVC